MTESLRETADDLIDWMMKHDFEVNLPLRDKFVQALKSVSERVEKEGSEKGHKAGWEDAVRECSAIASGLELHYSTNSVWNGFKWSPETETIILHGNKKVIKEILSLLDKEKK